MKKKEIVFILGALSILLSTTNSYADRRQYVWTYEYMTMLKGRWEAEVYVTTEVPRTNKSNINILRPQLELEYGITDNWDISMYQMWKFKNKANENDSEYEGAKLRTRYKIGEQGKYFFDPLLYFEYKYTAQSQDPHAGEAKLVFAKDVRDWNVSYNQIIEGPLANEGKWEHAYAFGVAKGITQRWRAGLEAKGNYSQEKYYLGPTTSYSFDSSWIAFGPAFGVNERSDDFQVRLIIGILF